MNSILLEPLFDADSDIDCGLDEESDDEDWFNEHPTRDGVCILYLIILQIAYNMLYLYCDEKTKFITM
jgi:hypothetical protein